MLPEEYSYVKPFILMGVGVVVLLHLVPLYYGSKLVRKSFEDEKGELLPGIAPEGLDYILPVSIVVLIPFIGFIVYKIFNLAKEKASSKLATSRQNATIATVGARKR
jgi:hypothetical protein